MADLKTASRKKTVAAAIERLHRQAAAARKAAHALSQAGTGQKDEALAAIAQALRERQDEIITANAQDVERAKGEQSDSFVDRLTLTPERIEAMAQGLEEVIALRDPIGEVIGGWTRPNGLQVQKVRVPLGVVAVIYESRPNVTIDALGLCLKTGNAIILRGGSDALASNRILVEVARDAVAAQGLPADAVQMVQDTDHEVARELMRLRGQVDLLIPRGGENLIRTVMETASVPVVETGTGTCHIYIHPDAPRDQVIPIVVNAKTQKPSVCNAMETLLVDAAVADELLPPVAEALEAKGVQLRGCDRTRAIVSSAQPATEDDWYAEYLDLILAVRVVDGLDDAVEHINRYGSHHSEAILTTDLTAARAFLSRVDSAAVYVNASTRFTDGFEYGFGAEIGISTQKLHARGPMGLPELTSYKFIVFGDGQLRG